MFQPGDKVRVVKEYSPSAFSSMPKLTPGDEYTVSAIDATSTGKWVFLEGVFNKYGPCCFGSTYFSPASNTSPMMELFL